MKHERNKLRIINWQKAIRKQKIAREVLGWEYYNNLHQYSKNKIHCSCPLCRGEEWSYGENSINQLKITDRKKISRMQDELEDSYYDE